jgi:murein DD-endopeptidase MepM/ murein hydrolase activator NlpD
MSAEAAIWSTVVRSNPRASNSSRAPPGAGLVAGGPAAGRLPGFGQPVLAPADATVVRAHDAKRDHWSRTSPPALLYLAVEGAVRELLGPGRILGNHLVLDLGGGVYAALAHLRGGSLRVRAGDRVTAGQPLAECGNSGNSTEPHLHFQLMDHPSVLLAAGLPFRFRHYQVGDAGLAGVPSNLERFSASAGPIRTGTAGRSPGRRR